MIGLAQVELGRHLFCDTRLSVNDAQSCASCHRQELAFTHAHPLSLSPAEKADLVEFLRSLTDEELLKDPTFARRTAGTPSQSFWTIPSATCFENPTHGR